MSEDTSGLEAILGWNAVKVGQLIGSRITAGLAGQDLSLVQFGVLSTLAESTDGLTTATIARAVFVRPQSMAEVVDGMECRGLVRRAGVRRQGMPNPVVLTPAGQAVFREARDVALGTNDLSDLGITTERAAQLNQLLLDVIQADSRS